VVGFDLNCVETFSPDEKMLDTGPGQGIVPRSFRRFMDQIRALTRRRIPLRTGKLIEALNPVLRGWRHHYKRAHVRKLFHRLDGWIVRRIRAHRCRRWPEDRVLAAMRQHPLGKEVEIIGTVTAAHPGLVTMRTTVGHSHRRHAGGRPIAANLLDALCTNWGLPIPCWKPFAPKRSVIPVPYR